MAQFHRLSSAHEMTAITLPTIGGNSPDRHPG